MNPLLIGELNPYGTDPKYALYPAPERSAGYRLAVTILGMRRAVYLRSFDRMNLCVGKWSVKEARVAAQAVVRGPGRKLVLLGSRVTSAFGLDFRPFTSQTILLGHPDGLPMFSIAILPHPSGLCRLWNEPGSYERARSVLQQMKII